MDIIAGFKWRWDTPERPLSLQTGEHHYTIEDQWATPSGTVLSGQVRLPASLTEPRTVTPNRGVSRSRGCPELKRQHSAGRATVLPRTGTPVFMSVGGGITALRAVTPAMGSVRPKGGAFCFPLRLR